MASSTLVDLGLYGSLFISSSIPTTGSLVMSGSWGKLEVVEPVIFRTLSGSLSYSASLLAFAGTGSRPGVTFPANSKLYGSFTFIQVKSGSLIAYNEPEASSRAGVAWRNL